MAPPCSYNSHGLADPLDLEDHLCSDQPIEPLSLTLSLSPYQPNPTTTTIHHLSSSISLSSYQDNRTASQPISTSLTLSVLQHDSSYLSLSTCSSTCEQYSGNHTQDLEDVGERKPITHDFGIGDTQVSQNSNNHVQEFSNGHRCDLCSKSFTSGQALGGHMTIHRKVLPKMNSKEKKRESNGERFYECMVCKKLFKSSQALSGHMRAHTSPFNTEASSPKRFFTFL
ncbi:hypothetical protein AMTRI_Chr13g116530 [Amborella trichopoda]